MIGPDPEPSSQEGEPGMEQDERDRRDWPEQDGGDAQPVEPDWGSRPEGEAAAPADEPEAHADEHVDPARDETVEPAEIESWPSQKATEPVEQPGEPAWPTEPPAAGDAPADTWPTEPPAAGDAPADTWPTEAPERDDQQSYEEPASEAGRDEPPPEEVEAYPASGESGEPPAAAALAPAPAHSVPDAEGTTGESTQCPRCGTENRPGLSFCRSCGQRLVAAGVSSTVERPGTPEGTMACPRCGTHNRAGVAFCQNCGANLRGTSEGYVPPSVAGEREAAPARAGRRGAILGPVVLLIGLVGLVTAYLLPFAYGTGSLFDRALGAGGYGAAFWNGYPEVGASLADQAYFGLAAPSPILGLLLAVLAVAGFVRAAPGPAQMVGLVLALLWSIGLIVLFVIVELAGNWTGDIVGLLRDLTPAGIIFFLSSLIVLIGVLTRFGRS
jgi:hypothetical protein